MLAPRSAHRLIEPSGAGGFGQIWKAHDLKIDRLIAVSGGLSHPRIVTS